MATHHTSMRSGARLFITLMATLSILAGQFAGLAVSPAVASSHTPYDPTPNNGDAYTGPADQYVIDGNHSCGTLGSFFGIETAGEIKFDFNPAPGESITQDGITVTITDRYTVRNGITGLFYDYVVTGDTADQIRSVFLKQANGGMLYLYAAPGVRADAGLHPQENNGTIWGDLSHISFCYDTTPPPADGTIIVEKVVDGTGTPPAGDFGFSLVCDGVTESFPLADGGTRTFTRPGGFTGCTVTETNDLGADATSWVITGDATGSGTGTSTGTPGFTVGEDQTATVTFTNTFNARGTIHLDKHDLAGNSLSGATLQLFKGSPGHLGDQVGDDCVTDGATPCSFTGLDLGTYTAVEAEAPAGYRLSGTTPKELTLSLSSPELTETFAFVNAPIPYRISVVEDDVNPVGAPHIFTVLVEHAPDTDDVWVPLTGAAVDLVWQASGDVAFAGAIIDVVTGTIAGDGLTGSCVTATGDGGLDAGTCEVTVDSGHIGKGELLATFTTPYQYASTPDAPTATSTSAAPLTEVADTATKEWRGLTVTIGDDGENLVGVPHTFTATVTETGTVGGPAAGVTVTVTWDGPAGSSIEGDDDVVTVAADGEPVTTFCVTDVSGTCDLEVIADAVASGTVTVVSLEGMIDGKPIVVSDTDETANAAFNRTENGDVTEASKTWVDFIVQIDGDATNHVDWDHTFEVTALKLTPSAPDGTPISNAEVFVTWATDGANRIAAGDRTDADGLAGSCFTDAQGTCGITVEALDPLPSVGTMTVTGIGNVGVSADGVVAPSGTGGVTVTVPQVDATKTWIDHGVTVTPDGINPLGTEDPADSRHTFTIEVERTPSDLGDDLSSIEVAFVWLGDVGSIVEIGGVVQDPGVAAGVCTVDTDGLCEVVVDSTQPGDGTLVVVGLTDTAVTSAEYPDGVTITFLTETELETFACTGDDPRCATKAWVAFEIAVTPDEATNHVEVEHTFTVELTDATTGLTTGFEVDAFTFRFDGTLADGEGGLGDDATLVSSTCDADASNPCTIVVSAEVPGTLRLTVTEATITLDGETYTLPFGMGADLEAAPAANQADKEFVDYRVTLEPPAVNLLGDEHLFEVVVERLTGDGAELAEGVDITLCWDGPAGSSLSGADATGCASFTTGSGDDAGLVTVTVSSPTVAGTGELTVASIDDDGEVVLPEGGAVTFGYVGGQEEAEKTWIVYDLELSNDALNPLGEDHDFVISNVTVDDGTGPVPAVGATITAVWSEDEVGETRTCTVDAAGTCTITVASPTVAGSGTLTLTLLEHTFQGESFTVDLTDTQTAALAEGAAGQDATKVWRDYRVEIAPDDINLTGQSHTFTVTIEQTDDGEIWMPVPDGSTLTSDEVVGFDLITTGLDVDDLDVGGSCLHTSTVVPELGGTVGGECTLTVTSDVPGQVEVVVHTVLVLAMDAPVVQPLDGSLPERPLDHFGETTYVLAEEHQDSATKTWVRIDASVTPPSATNLAAESHDFEVVVTVDDGGAGVTLDRMELCFTWTGDGTPRLETPCVELDAEALTGLTGAYTYTVDAPDGPTSGMGTLELVAVEFDVSLGEVSQGFVVPNEDGFGLGVDLSSGEAVPLEFPITATKLWVDYGLTVDSDVNPLPGGEAHTFGVTLRSSDPGTLAEGYLAGAAPVAGQDVQIALSYAGIGAVTHVDGVSVGDGFDASGFPCSPSPVVDGDEVVGRCTVTVATDWTGHPSEGVGIGTLTAAFQGAAADSDATLDLEAIGTKHWIAIVVEKEAVVTADEIAVGELVELAGAKVMLVDGEVQEVYEVDYRFTVTNPTVRPLQVLGFTDVFFSRGPVLPVGEQDLLEAFIDANGSDVLAAGESIGFVVTFTLTEEDVERGFIDNTVTVVAVDEETGTPVTDSDDESVGLIQVAPRVFEPSISVVKDAVDGVTDDGEGNLLVTITGQDGTATVTYRYVVTNTGDDDLTDLTLIDDKIGDLSDELVAAVTAEFGGPVLPVDGQVTITATHEVSAGDFDGLTLTNLVDVTGLGVDSGATVTDDDAATVVLVQVLAEAEELPRTGTNGVGLLGLGLLLTVLGTAALLFERRRGATRR